MSETNNNNNEAITSEQPQQSQQQQEKPFQKIKVAIIFGYVGYGYFGLQHNFDPLHPTIEAELIEALHQASYISDENMMGTFLKKINWERASRTDKGVSALRNVANAKLQLPKNQTEAEWIAPLNAILKPKRIEIFRIIPTTSSFDCYTSCTGRKYEYLLPTYALLPPLSSSMNNHDDDQNENEEEYKLDKKAAEIRELLIASGPQQQVENNNSSNDEQNQNPNQQQRRRQRDDPTVEATDLPQEIFFTKMLQHRVSPATIHRIRGFFTQMEGTNSFHNFTPVVTADQAAALRFMRSIEVSDPFIIPLCLKTPKSFSKEDAKLRNLEEVQKKNEEGNNNNNDDDDYEMKVYDVEWVRIRLDGQSFMLNQIRKMIGCAVEVINRGGDATMIRDMFSKSFRRIMPMAPANGLFLATLKLDQYNHKLERIQQQGEKGSLGKELIIIPDVPADDDMRALVEKCIGEQECRGQITARWVAGLMRTKPEDWIPKATTTDEE